MELYISNIVIPWQNGLINAFNWSVYHEKSLTALQCCSISFFRLTWHLKVSKTRHAFGRKKRKTSLFVYGIFREQKNPTRKILGSWTCPLLKLPHPRSVPLRFFNTKIRGKDGNVDWYFDCVCQVLAMIDRLFESMLLFKSGKSHQSDPWVESWMVGQGVAFDVCSPCLWGGFEGWCF